MVDFKALREKREGDKADLVSMLADVEAGVTTKRPERKIEGLAQVGETSVVQGQVTRVMYAHPNGTFSIAQILTPQKELITVKGKAGLAHGDFVKLEGVWIKDPRFGLQLDIKSVLDTGNLDVDGLAHYLANNPAMKFIGMVRARKIADAFGEDLSDALENRPDEVMRVGQLTPDAFDDLKDEWFRHQEFNALYTWLSAHGLTMHQVKVLSEKFQGNTRKVLSSNPYVLMDLVDGFGFKKTDIIAQKMGVEKEHPERVKGGILYTLKDELEHGHTWIEREELVSKVRELLALDCMISQAETLILEQLAEMVNHATDAKVVELPFSFGIGVALSYVWEVETDIWMRMRGFFRGKHRDDLFTFNRYAEKHGDLQTVVVSDSLNTLQREAVMNALDSSKSLMSGGAGVGKTFTLREICRIFTENDLEVALCAPTGKAAKRMNQATGLPAFTIHRLLDYDPRASNPWTRNESNPLTVNLVVVDETSMVDIFIMQALLKAIDPTTTALLLVGDHNQLPSIGPGSVLRDLIRYEAYASGCTDGCNASGRFIERELMRYPSGESRADTCERGWRICPGRRPKSAMVRDQSI